MTMQAASLREKGINAAYISGSEDPHSYSEEKSCTVTVQDIVSSDTNVWIASPETCLGSLREKITEASSSIRAVFIDEAHCILK